MSTTAEEVLKEALRLSESERARVAAELLASLEPDIETRDEEAWIAEVERRAQAAIAGVPGLSWDETRARVVNTYVGSDRVRRVNLKFLDRGPSHLVRTS